MKSTDELNDVNTTINVLSFINEKMNLKIKSCTVRIHFLMSQFSEFIYEII